eukprot:4854166-Prymnesium_polylepis.1
MPYCPRLGQLSSAASTGSFGRMRFSLSTIRSRRPSSATVVELGILRSLASSSSAGLASPSRPQGATTRRRPC